jgi:hypothetical protein
MGILSISLVLELTIFYLKLLDFSNLTKLLRYDLFVNYINLR